MSRLKVTVILDIGEAKENYHQRTTYTANPTATGVDKVERKIREFVGDLDDQETLDYGPDGNVTPIT